MAQIKTDATVTAAVGKKAAGPVTAPSWSPPKAMTDAASLPRLPPSAPFLLMAHPDRWQVMGGMVVALLGRLLLQPGLANVRAARDGSPLWKEAAAKREEKGWVSIPWDVDGPDTSYVVQPNPGAHIERWARVYPRSDRIDCDEVGYRDWLRSLVDRGIIAPPPLHILRRMLETERNDLARALEASSTSATAQAEVKRLEKVIAAIESEIAAQEAAS